MNASEHVIPAYYPVEKDNLPVEKDNLPVDQMGELRMKLIRFKEALQTSKVEITTFWGTRVVRIGPNETARLSDVIEDVIDLSKQYFQLPSIPPDDRIAGQTLATRVSELIQHSDFALKQCIGKLWYEIIEVFTFDDDLEAWNGNQTLIQSGNLSVRNGWAECFFFYTKEDFEKSIGLDDPLLHEPGVTYHGKENLYYFKRD